MTIVSGMFRPDLGPEVSALTAGYQLFSGVYDEMMDADGGIRPHWRAFLETLAGIGTQEPAARFAAADRHLEEAGVVYRLYGAPGAGERPWRLSPLPLILPPEEWKILEAGMLQRAALLEALLADCYGSCRLTAEGALPPALLAGSPDYLRPLVGVLPPSGRHLALYAADLVRSPSGEWRVLRDRTQAPAGLGYALENRVALARALPELFGAFAVERLAPFLDAFRSWLARLRQPGDAGIFVLTPGPFNETWFEHASLARYLGMQLVEGQDLTVRHGALYLKTVSGLVPVRVLWRRIDGAFADPLELESRSELGIPGLVEALRQGALDVANAAGSGLGEATALLGFLPALAPRLTGAPLILPNIATWWCGQKREREYVEVNAASLAIVRAFRPQPLMRRGPEGEGPILALQLPEDERAILLANIRRRGMDYAGQELITLGTMPAWREGRLEPRPFILRLFAAATSGGFTVMPGGLAFVGDEGALPGPSAFSLSIQKGARTADVWVLSPGGGSGRGAEDHSAPEAKPLPQKASGLLPSRAADNLFWLGRYTERAEAVLRLVRALAQRLTHGAGSVTPEAAGTADLLFKWGAAPAAFGVEGLAAAAGTALANAGWQGSAAAVVRAAREAALPIRNRLPPDTGHAWEELEAEICAPADPGVHALAAKANRMLRTLAAISGFQAETMHRLAGWPFLECGRRLERAIAVCRFVRQFAPEGGVSPAVAALLLELTGSQPALRPGPALDGAAPILALVLMEKGNPRALAFQVERISELAGLLTPEGVGSPAVAGAAADVAAAFHSLDAGNVNPQALLAIENQLMRLSSEICANYFSVREVLAPSSTLRRKAP